MGDGEGAKRKARGGWRSPSPPRYGAPRRGGGFGVLRGEVGWHGDVQKAGRRSDSHSVMARPASGLVAPAGRLDSGRRVRDRWTQDVGEAV